MTAYLVARVDVTDPVAFEEYRLKVPAVVAAHGGRYLVRGGAIEGLEGDAAPNRVVILEFADMAQLKAFYHSEAYRPLLELRQRAARTSAFSIEGV